MAQPKWQRRAEERPGEICAAALEVFAEKGFAGARLDEIAHRAGVSKGTLYLYFKDKNELFKIDVNVLLGCLILKYYLEVERGDLVKGLARYNGSRGKRNYADRVIEKLRTKWFRI